MLKKELRQKYKSLRKSISEENLEEMSLAIANKVVTLPIWEKNYFHIFLSITEHKEVNTEYILHILFGKDKNIILSKSDFETLEMTHYVLTDSTKILKNKFNIPEPVEGLEVPTEKIQVIFVPLLAFDLDGNRVGYGKGFYDKFMKNCKPDTIKIGLSFFEAEEKIDGILDTDIQLDFCVTPNQVYQFIY